MRADHPLAHALRPSGREPARRALLAGAAGLLLAGPAAARERLHPPAWFGDIVDDPRLSALRDLANARSQQALDRASAFARRAAPQLAGPALAASIRLSRAQARSAGVQPPPETVRRTLAAYFPTINLAAVGWTLTARRLQLGSELTGWYATEGAVTLHDVVVFSDRRTAANLWLWAHELTHVEQYLRLGLDGFAARYAADWRSLEREATDNAFRITADLRRRGVLR